MTVIVGDSRKVLATLPSASFDAVVTDPPYELNFGGNAWDRTGVAFDLDLWRAVLEVAKPGAHLLAFGATRLYHRLAIAIEDAGWEIRDCFVWAYAGGMPHSTDIAAAIDREVGGTPLQIGRQWVGDPHKKGRPKRLRRVTAPSSGEAQQWRGWGTGLRPAWEPIVVARRPFDGAVHRNVLQNGTGALNVGAKVNGSWPANIVATDPVLGRLSPFFTVPKAKGQRRAGADHPTVKPLDLMVHLLRVVVPPGGAVLDPFGGSGSTGVAAVALGMVPTLIEMDPGYAAQAKERMEMVAP